MDLGWRELLNAIKDEPTKSTDLIMERGRHGTQNKNMAKEGSGTGEGV